MKRPVIISLIIVALVLIWFFRAQRNNEDAEAVQAMIEETLQERLKNYREIRAKICRNKVQEAATVIADSILIEEARMKKDTLLKPPKPEKPQKPEIKTVIDSVPVAPFLRKDSLQKDSIKKSDY